MILLIFTQGPALPRPAFDQNACHATTITESLPPIPLREKGITMAPSTRRACTTLAALLLSLIAILSLPYPSAAQQTSPASPLPAPVLSAQAKAGAVDLTWTEVPTAARYELISWWDAATGWQQLSGDNLTGAAFDHTDLTIGVTYHYRIRAVNADGQQGAWSEPVSAAPHADLAAPVLYAQPAAGAVDLSWTDVPDAARYQLISWWDAATGWQQLGGDNLTAKTYPHPGLAVATTYHYQIRARNAAGEPGPWSEPVSATVSETQSSAPIPTPLTTSTATPTPTETPTPFATSTATPTPTETPTPLISSTPTPTHAHAHTHANRNAHANIGYASSQTAPVLVARGIEGAVELSWTEVSTAVRYELITWWQGLTDWQPIGGDNLTGTTFLHPNLGCRRGTDRRCRPGRRG